MKQKATIVARLALVAILALVAVGITASPVRASHMVVVTISGDVFFPAFGVTVQVGAHARGPAGALSGQGFDQPGKPGGVVPPGYCRFPLSGALVGSVVTLSGIVTFSTDPTLVGAPVTLTADASTGSITFDFGPFTATGTGSVVIAH